MKTQDMPEVNWAQLYGKLAEAVDHAGFEIVWTDGLMNLTPKEQPVRFMLDMDGSMIPDAEGDWVRA